jgi:hypothetical protein
LKNFTTKKLGKTLLHLFYQLDKDKYVFTSRREKGYT